jgi:aryl-alcohol dehydrogenase-like predicted oxidoreductase
MRYKLLGHSGVRVSELCLGAMTFGDVWDIGVPKEESRKVFDHFAKAGGNFIDTAVNYTDGQSETILGDFLKADRDHFVVATKYSGNNVNQEDLNKAGDSRKNMMISVERSLKRLQTDYIDLYYLHVWDYTTPVEEVMRAADDLVRQGKILYFAISDTPEWVITEACTRAELMGWTRPVAVQVPYSLAWRDVERGTLPMAKYWDLAVCTWGMLDGGVLSGKYGRSTEEPRRYKIDQLDERRQKIVATLQEVANESGHTPSQAAINWVRQCPYAQVIPIIGARTVKQLDDNLACLEWILTEEQMNRLNAATGFGRGYPEDLLIDTRPYLFGKSYDLLDNHRPGSYETKA